MKTLLTSRNTSDCPVPCPRTRDGVPKFAAPTDNRKSAQSAEIAALTAAFVKDGGKIEQVPPGALKGWVNLTRQYPERAEA